MADSQVGIDVEKNKRIDLDIGKQYFAKDEYNSILLQPPELRSKRLLEFWTLKESYLKYLGYGLVMELSSFCVSYDGDKASLTSGEKKADFGKLNFANKNYVGFVCTEEGKIQENVQVKMISIHELIKDINSNLEDKKQR